MVVMRELRAAARARTHISGSVLTAFAVTGEPCLIQNISPRGASVVFREGFAIPRRFNLVIGRDRHAQQALKIWRNGNVAGVKFLEFQPNAPEVLLG